MFISIHRYENGKFWPHLKESNYDYIGASEGRGYNVNIPLNEVGCGDADYMAVFWNIIWPLATQFNPDFIIVSAGEAIKRLFYGTSLVFFLCLLILFQFCYLQLHRILIQLK
uniref:Hist_deacetyl domain-containing protein n=1 Tax=Angiostrongylus cantonensis TaxID=6313 RepID=A0A0K0DIQ3_ANGCA